MIATGTEVIKKQSDCLIDGRVAWADLCRVIAIFGVMVIHACGANFHQYGNIPQDVWRITSLLDSLFRCSVPLFVMLSGALLLKPGEYTNLQQIMGRVGKILFPLLTWNVGFLLYVAHYNKLPINWTTMLTDLPMYHLWFVYMMIGLYLFLPLFQALFNMMHSSRSMQVYLLGIWFVVTCVPIYLPIPLLTLIQQTSFLGYGGYFLIGGIIASSKRDPVHTLAWLLIYITGASVTYLLTQYFCEKAHAAIEPPYVSPIVFVCSIAAFTLITRVSIPDFIKKYLLWMADKTFLVFFMHVVILERVSRSNAILLISRHIPTFTSILLIAFCTFIISLFIATGIRLLPWSRRIFG